MAYKISEISALKEEYYKVIIPVELDQAILSGLSEGRVKKVTENRSKRLINLCASIVFALVILTSAINISPTFADGLSEMPFIGRLVEILMFVDGKGGGGQVTDGTDISDIHVVQNGDQEEIVINFSQLESLQSISAAYQITHYASPIVMQFDIGGARMISAREDFDKIKALDAVQDIYTLMTLDDSLIRFNIVFAYPIDFEVQEFVNPAGIKLTVSKIKGTSSEEIYTVRTPSYPLSESFAHLEEELMRVGDMRVSKDYRILKDDNGGFTFEFAIFSSYDEANDFLNEIENLVSMPLVIEKRQSNAIPQYIEIVIQGD